VSQFVPNPIVIIGVGNLMRGDDGIGPRTAHRCAMTDLPSCDVIELDGETSRIIDAWAGRSLAIVVDAIRTGARAGTLHDLSVDDIVAIDARNPSMSSHASGLAAAIELGQALDRLPTRLRIVGIEPAEMSHGTELSAAVQMAMPDLEARVVAIASGHSSSPVDEPSSIFAAPSAEPAE